MKKIIIAVMLLASFKAQSQTVDTAIKEYYAARINPIVFKHSFPIVTDTLKWVGYFKVDVIGKDSAVVDFFVKSNTQQNIILDNISLSKEQFLSWVDEKSILRYVLNYLKYSFPDISFK